VLASEKEEELKTRKNCMLAGYGLFDKRVVHIAYLVVKPLPYAAVVRREMEFTESESELRRNTRLKLPGENTYRTVQIDHL